MLFFFPPIVQVLVGAGLVAAGLAVHKVPLDIIGGIILILGGARFLRKPRGGTDR